MSENLTEYHTFREFVNNLPVISECIVGSDNIATLKFGNNCKNDEIKIRLAILGDGYPKQIKEVISGLLSYMYCIILAPYITDQTAEICKKADIGFLDMAGNCYIACKSLYVEIRGNKNEKKLTKVKLRATGVTTVEKGAFKAMAKKGTIYVSGSKKQFKKLKKLIVKSGLPKGVKVKRA